MGSGNFQIGTTQATMETLNKDPARAEYIDVYRKGPVGVDGNGHAIFQGYDEVEWIFDALEGTDFIQLAYYRQLADPTVYIKTRVVTGSWIDYKTCLALFHSLEHDHSIPLGITGVPRVIARFRKVQIV